MIQEFSIKKHHDNIVDMTINNFKKENLLEMTFFIFDKNYDLYIIPVSFENDEEKQNIFISMSLILKFEESPIYSMSFDSFIVIMDQTNEEQTKYINLRPSESPLKKDALSILTVTRDHKNDIATAIIYTKNKNEIIFNDPIDNTSEFSGNLNSLFELNTVSNPEYISSIKNKWIETKRLFIQSKKQIF